jgi:RNA polymerase sigma factor (sigma-70 family)
MAGQALRTVIHHLHRVSRREGIGSLPDVELLRRFVEAGDEAAFEVLVWRHAPLVLGLCRRLLHHRQDAEDAFQATFIAFLRGARSIGKGGSVGSWLYKVAYRLALKAKARAARQARPLPDGLDVPAGSTTPGLDWGDLRPILDEEVNRLPEKYRVPVVLCYLEGKTCTEAARAIGCPRGTVVTRLARARGRLRARLTHRGLGLSTGLLAACLSPSGASATVPPALIRATIDAGLLVLGGRALTAVVPASVFTLVQGVTRSMLLMHRLKLLVITVAAGVLFAGGTGALSWRLLAAGHPAGTVMGFPLLPAEPAAAQAAENHPDDWVGYECREMKGGPELAVVYEGGNSKVYPAAADAAIIAYLPDRAWGQLAVPLSIDLRDQNRSLLRFEPVHGSKVRKAEIVLRLAADLKKLPPQSFEMGVYEVAEAWDEGRVTWANQPRFAERPALTVRVDPKEKELRIDVTKLIRRPGGKEAPNFGWLFKVARPLLEKPAAELKPFRRPAPAARDPKWVAYAPREMRAGPELVVTREDGSRKTYPVAADAVLISYLADNAFGGFETWLSVDLADRNRILLRFDPPAAGPIRKAELVLRAVEPPADSRPVPLPEKPFLLGIHEVREAWDEASVTWATQPEFAEQPALKVKVDPRAKELRLDVTALVRRLGQAGTPRHGWLLRVAEPKND